MAVVEQESQPNFGDISLFDPQRTIIRKSIERGIIALIALFSVISIVILLGTVATMVVYSADFLTVDHLLEIVFEDNWYTNKEAYGAFAMVYGTFFMGIPALLLAILWGVGAAIFLSEYVPQTLARRIQPVVEFVAAIPTVIMGLIAFEYISQIIVFIFGRIWFRDLTAMFGARDGAGLAVTSGRGFLAAILTVSFIAAPIIASISYDAMQSTPALQRQAAKAFGATKQEVFANVVYPHAKQSIFASVMLAFGRIVGETMIVLMVLGSSPNVTTNIFAPGYTLTAAIAGEIGDASFSSGEFRVLFVLGLILLVIAFIIIWIAGLIERQNKYLMAFVDVISTPFDYIADSFRQVKQRFVDRVEITDAVIEKQIDQRKRANRINSFRKGAVLVLYLGMVFSLLFVMLSDGMKYFFLEGVLEAPGRFIDFIISVPNTADRNQGLYGIKQAIGGSTAVLFFSCLLAFPISTAAGIFLYEFAGDGKIATIIRNSIINISAIPSIVVGLFVYGAFSIGLGWERGVLPGAIALGIMMIPIISTNTIEALRNVPDAHRQSAIALGATKWEAVSKHKLPYAFPSIITGYILSIARVIGETAPILLVAASFSFGTTDFFPPQLTEWGIRMLPYEIFYNLLYEIKSVDGVAMGPLWAKAAAIVLLLAVLFLNFLAYGLRNIIRRRYEYNGNL